MTLTEMLLLVILLHLGFISGTLFGIGRQINTEKILKALARIEAKL